MHAKPLDQLEVEKSEKGCGSYQFPAKVARLTEWSPQPETLNWVIFRDHCKIFCLPTIVHAFACLCWKGSNITLFFPLPSLYPGGSFYWFNLAWKPCSKAFWEM